MFTAASNAIAARDPGTDGSARGEIPAASAFHIDDGKSAGGGVERRDRTEAVGCGRHHCHCPQVGRKDRNAIASCHRDRPFAATARTAEFISGSAAARGNPSVSSCVAGCATRDLLRCFRCCLMERGRRCVCGPRCFRPAARAYGCRGTCQRRALRCCAPPAMPRSTTPCHDDDDHHTRERQTPDAPSVGGTFTCAPPSRGVQLPTSGRKCAEPTRSSCALQNARPDYPRRSGPNHPQQRVVDAAM